MCIRDSHERDPYPAGVLEPDLFDLACYDLMLRRAQDPKYRKRDDDRRYELDKRGAEVRQTALNAEGKAALALREVVIGGRDVYKRQVDLLVRTAGHAHAPATAFILIDQDDAVLFALVYGA